MKCIFALKVFFQCFDDVTQKCENVFFLHLWPQEDIMNINYPALLSISECKIEKAENMDNYNRKGVNFSP